MKKMNLKVLVLGAAVVLSSAFANAAMDTMSDARLAQTKEAVQYALDHENMVCQDANGAYHTDEMEKVQKILKESNQGAMSDDAQGGVMMIFVKMEGGRASMLTMSASSNNRQIETLQVTTSHQEKVNTGDLKNINMQEQQVNDSSVICTLAH